jgi:hypothetical protein
MAFLCDEHPVIYYHRTSLLPSQPRLIGTEPWLRRAPSYVRHDPLTTCVGAATRVAATSVHLALGYSATAM